MKRCIFALTGALVLTSGAIAQQADLPVLRSDPDAPVSLETIVRDYETGIRALSPAVEARMEGRSPRRWPDVTPDHVASLARRAQNLKLRLNRVEDKTSPEWAILSHLFEGLITQDRFDTARIPFTGDWGFHAEPFYTASNLRLRNEDEAEAWLARLNDTPRYFNDNIANMKRGLRMGWTAHADPLGTTMDQIRQQIVGTPEDSALWRPFETLPETMAPETAEAIRTAGREAVMKAVAAYADLLAFMEQEYAPEAREDPGIASLPAGRAYYEAAIRHHTAGAGYTPEEIHALGRAEVERIREEMETIIEEIGYPGTFEDFLHFLRTDPQFYARSPEDLLEKASRISKRLDALLPEYFGMLPRLTYGVEPVPDAIAPGYTTGRYSSGDPEEGEPGTYLVNTYALDQRPLYELPALSAHEAVPGHHLQIALAQELEDAPRFRREYYATAFGEGWGLYAEKLAGEAGFYQTPYERFGALSYEMWRACRLVADTGMHWYGWSREEAERCFAENSALAPLNIQTEVTRYIGWPGQATAYKVGELKILELRAQARESLGDAFDIRVFHDVLLGEGSMPLDALERRIEIWIQQQLPPEEKDAEAVAP